MLYDKNIGIRKKVDLMEQLTKSEREIAILVMEGLTNKEIASKLFISVHTVKANLEHIYEKLAISNRILLAIYVLKAIELKDRDVSKKIMRQ